MKLLAKAAVAALTAWACSAAFAISDPAHAGTPAAAHAIEDPSPSGSDAEALAGQAASDDARYAWHWIHAASDNRAQPFAIVDKKAARLYVFDGAGALVGSTPTLLGIARGDVAVPGSSAKQPSQLLPGERRTPAGRFRSEPGRNLNGEPVVWVDYGSGIAIHRVRPGASQALRLRSLSDELPDDKRLSLGCVVVPEPFFSGVVLPTLGHSRGTVYILPEDEPVQAMLRPPVEAAPGAARTVAVSAVTHP